METEIAYAELHCYSNFSFLTGASHPEELIETAKKNRYQAIAITDKCSLAGIVRAHKKADELSIKLLIGSELTLDNGITFILLTPTLKAYQQLTQLITLAHQNEFPLVTLTQFKAYTDDCIKIWLPTLEQCHDNTLLSLLQENQHNHWIGITNHHYGNDIHITQQRRRLAHMTNVPTVACGQVYMHTKERIMLQHTLTAIRYNTSIQECGFRLLQNAEHYLRKKQDITQLYDPLEIKNTQTIADQCTFTLKELKYEYPKIFLPKNTSPSSYLAAKVNEGAKNRWPDGVPESVKEQLKKELSIIADLQYECYFLTVYDIVSYAKSKHILCQGRGSAANSAVCFCLFITEVDPAKNQLLFERFISKERHEPPDIDVDFENERREEVIQFIYQKYGRTHAALTATVISYRIKSAIKDIGKALNLDNELLNKFARSIAWWDNQEQFPEQLKSLGINPNNPKIERFLTLINTIIGFPRHLSQHVGGFILSHHPLNHIVPIENASMPERTIVQWDKDDIETLGLMKIDVLALGMLTAIRKCFDYIALLRQQRYTMATLPPEDPSTYAMLQKGDSIGVFQVESRAQMAMLPRLKPKNFYDLVIQVAIVRPGPIQGNMVHPYLKRRDKTEPIHYESPDIKGVLKRTLGVPIFQEQVIQLAMVAAGFSPGDADKLRRSMASWKKKGQLRQYQKKLNQGLLERGYSQDFADRIIAQINGFGEYGFPESHAASFALLVYVSAWMKCHEPAAFCCALLNSQPMGFYSPAQLIQDAQRHHICVLPIDVQHSHWDHSLEWPTTTQQHSQHNSQHDSQQRLEQPCLRLGLRFIKGLARQSAQRIIEARTRQPLQSLYDLQHRASLNKQDLHALANSDALHTLTGHRHQAHWTIQGIQPHSPLVQHAQQQETTIELSPPSEAQSVVADYNYNGVTLRSHPLLLLRQHRALRHCKTREDLNRIRHQGFVRIAGLVTGRQRPLSAAGVMFLTLEDETGNTNIIVWKNVVERQRASILQARLLLVKGTVERSKNVIHVVAGHVVDLTPLLGKLTTHSRDFH